MKTHPWAIITNRLLLFFFVTLLSACSSPHSGDPEIHKYYNPEICDTCPDTGRTATHPNDRFYNPSVLPLKKGTVKDLHLCTSVTLKNTYAPTYQNDVHNNLVFMGEFTHKWFGNPRLWTRALKDSLQRELTMRNATVGPKGDKLLQIAVTNIQIFWETRKIECRVTTTVQTDEATIYPFSVTNTATDLYGSCDEALSKSVAAILNSGEIRNYLLDVTPGCDEQNPTTVSLEEPLESKPIGIMTGRTTSPMLPVYFDFDKSSIRDDQVARMEVNADFLKDKGNVKIRLEGNCDSRGTREYNLALGERRALIAKEYLINRGIAADRISTVSFGKENLLFHGDDEMSHAKNRRDDFVVE